MIKAAFFDIDGTLLSHELGDIPKDTKEALKSLQEKGIKIFTSTGRHMLEFEQVPLDGIVFDGYVLVNGQICLNREQELIFDIAIDEEDIQGLLPLFEERKFSISFVEKDRLYSNIIDEKAIQAQNAVCSEVPEEGTYQGDKVYLVIVYDDGAQLEQVLQRMPHCKMTRWNPYGVDIVSVQAGKAKGMEQMLAYYGLHRDEIIAFGDGENDMEMLEYAGIGVAMGNAEEKVKACADYVTRDVNDGGISSALKHFGIL